MRILTLTPAIEKRLLAARQTRDAEAEQVASEIVADVRKRGDAALFAWTRKLDGSAVTPKTLWLSQKQIRRASLSVSADFLQAIRQAARNIRRVAERQLPRAWSIETEPGVRIRQIVRPIEAIGCYIPGGHFSLVSTLVMTAVPAAVAGVPHIIAVCPKPNNELLATAKLLGVSDLAHIGGAQAVAALAYGTKSVPRVDKIFGPGNKYVTAAKQLVSSDCAIDVPAGPTEVVVLADRGNAKWIASDLLAQAEHAADAGSFLVTTSKRLAHEVQQEVERQLAGLPVARARASAKTAGAILVAYSLDRACEFVNRFAPEHLSLPEGGKLLKKIRSAGTIFIGPFAAQPLGDYATGSNHVLPTGGWARTRGGLSTSDFFKTMTTQTVSRNGFRRLADTVETLAEAEGLLAHRNAVRIRR